MYTLLLFVVLYPVSDIYAMVFDKKGNIVVWFRVNNYTDRTGGRVSLSTLDKDFVLQPCYEYEVAWKEHYKVYSGELGHSGLKSLRGDLMAYAKRATDNNAQYAKQLFDVVWHE